MKKLKYVKLFEDYTSNEISNFEKIILESLISIIPLNESKNGDKVVGKSTFSKIINKVKDFSKKGVLTTGIILSLLGSANFTQAQETQLKNQAKTEKSIKNDEIIIAGAVSHIRSFENKQSVVNIAGTSYTIEKIKDEYIGYANSKEVFRKKSMPSKSDIKSLVDLCKEYVVDKYEKMGGSKDEIKWTSSDGVNFSSRYHH
jgi:hypothetical protein